MSGNEQAKTIVNEKLAQMQTAEKAAHAAMAEIEPTACTYSNNIQVSKKELVLLSIAISLKRIADAIEHMDAVS